VGWILAPEEVVPSLVAAKQGIDSCTGGITQRIAARFLARGLLRKQIRAWSEMYERRQQLLLAALEEHFGAVEVLVGAGPPAATSSG
jgi:DNA-binding transcriptional MocR family regulator